MKRVKKKLVEKFFEENTKMTFNWEFANDCPIIVPNELTDYEKNLFIKNELLKKTETSDFLKNSYWIIQTWGGIKSFKQNSLNDEKIMSFIEKIKGNTVKLNKNEFEIISSLSKIAAFLLPERFCIYDSRVIYSLNWHIFLYGDSLEMFPQPTGRNKMMIEYDQRTIFNLSKIPYTFCNTKDAFQKYCEL